MRAHFVFFLIGFSLAAKPSQADVGQACLRYLSQIGDSALAHYHGIFPALHGVPEGRKPELLQALRDIPNRSVDLKTSEPILKRLPDGIPSELKPAIEELNKVMGDNQRFVDWLIDFEIEAEHAVANQAGLATHLPREQRHLIAIKKIVAERAQKNGWPERVLVFDNFFSVNDWRDMQRQSSLFIDVGFRDEARQAGGLPHTAAAHLLQLLYASEALNSNPWLIRDLGGRSPMPALMKFMGRGHLVDGKPFDPDTHLTWHNDPATQHRRGSSTLWDTFFDGPNQIRVAFNRAETVGHVYHSLPILRSIENWAEEAVNFIPLSKREAGR